MVTLIAEADFADKKNTREISDRTNSNTASVRVTSLCHSVVPAILVDKPFIPSIIMRSYLIAPYIEYMGVIVEMAMKPTMKAIAMTIVGSISDIMLFIFSSASAS